MDLFAAIDIRDRRAVRLVQGDFERGQDYGDPLELAADFVNRGARWLHVVDLDAARTGEPENRDLVTTIARIAREAGVRVETGGGVRAEHDVVELLDAGLTQVVLGTAALEDPTMAVRSARSHPGAVAIGLDYRRRSDGVLEPATRGWLGSSGRNMTDTLALFAGEPFAAIVVTAIERDGTLSGPDHDGLADVLDHTDVPVIASGGVGSAADLRMLASLRAAVTDRRLRGVIVGKALVDGRVVLEEAMAACEASE